MLKIDRRKFFNYYLPTGISVVLIAAAGIGYVVFMTHAGGGTGGNGTHGFYVQQGGKFMQRGGKIVIGGKPSGGGATPGLVNFAGMPNSYTESTGTTIDNTCSTNAYCTQLVDASVSGSTIVVPYTYAAASAHIPTVTDDKSGGSSTYTCVTEANIAADTRYAGMCYSLNVTSGIRNITVSFGAAVTRVGVAASQWYNINAFDVSTNNSGTTNTTFTAGSAASTAAGDLWIMLTCATHSPQNTGAFTAGSQTGITWSMDLADRVYGCAVQHGIQTAAGALNPQLTIGTGDAFVAVAAAFKAGTSGIAPSGMYIAHLYHMDTPGSTPAGAFSIQMPTSGNLMVIAAQNSGSGAGISSISDSPNTYALCPGVINTNAQIYYAANLTNGLRNITLNLSAIGDLGPALIYDVVGAATTQTCIKSSGSNNSGNSSNTSLVFMPGYAPGASSGISFLTLGNAVNTVVGMSAPTGVLNDVNTVGGENLDGPWNVDQNNGGAHRTFSDNTPGNWTATYTLSLATHDTQWWAQVASFQAPGAAMRPSVVNTASNQNAGSATTLAVSISPSAGHALVIAVGDGNSRTVTKVCTDGGTCAAGNSFTQAASNGTAACSSGTLRSDIWYLLSAPSGVTTVTVTYSATATNREALVWEVAGLTAFDIANHTASLSVSGGVATGAGVLTTASDGFVAASAVVSNTITASPAWQLNGTTSGNEFSSPGIIWSNTTDAAASLISTAATTHTPAWNDASGTYCGATAAFK